MVHTHQTAPTQFVEANGIRLAYRRFGKAGGVPLVFMQHFRGGMDHSDPTVTDGFAEARRPQGPSGRDGICERKTEPPTSAQTMVAQRAAIIEWRQPRGER